MLASSAPLTMADVPAWKQALIRAREEKARQAEAASKQGDVDLEQKFAHLPAWKRDHEIRKAKAKQAKDEEHKVKQDEIDKQKATKNKHALAHKLEMKVEQEPAPSRRMSVQRAAEFTPEATLTQRIQSLAKPGAAPAPSPPSQRRNRRQSSKEVHGFTLIDAVPVKEPTIKTSQSKPKSPAVKASPPNSRAVQQPNPAPAPAHTGPSAEELAVKAKAARDKDERETQALIEEEERRVREEASRAKRDAATAEAEAQRQQAAWDSAEREKAAAAAEKDKEKRLMAEAAAARKAMREADEEASRKAKEEEESKAKAIRERAKSRQAHPDLVQTHDDNEPASPAKASSTPGVSASGEFIAEPIPDNETAEQTKSRKNRDRVARQKARVLKRQLATSANAKVYAAAEDEEAKKKAAEDAAKAEAARKKKESEDERKRQLDEDQRKQEEDLAKKKAAWVSQKATREALENQTAAEKDALVAKEQGRRDALLNGGPTSTMSWPKGCLPDPAKLKLKRKITWGDAGGESLCHIAPMAFYDDEAPEDIQTNQMGGGDDDDEDGLSTPVHTQIKKRHSPSPKKSANAPSMGISDAVKRVTTTERVGDALPDDESAASFNASDSPFATMLW